MHKKRQPKSIAASSNFILLPSGFIIAQRFYPVVRRYNARLLTQYQ
jgi:hypothetical protein